MSNDTVRSIMVVDDEPLIASTLATILNQRGYSVRFFTNPVEALESALLQAPDLLISDVVMPRLSGIDLAIQIREQCPGCRILLFSGQAATADLLRAARSKGYNFRLLEKPIHPTDLLRGIESLGRQ